MHLAILCLEACSTGNFIRNCNCCLLRGVECLNTLIHGYIAHSNAPAGWPYAKASYSLCVAFCCEFLKFDSLTAGVAHLTNKTTPQNSGKIFLHSYWCKFFRDSHLHRAYRGAKKVCFYFVKPMAKDRLMVFHCVILPLIKLVKLEKAPFIC